MTVIHTVYLETVDHDEAIAIRDIIRELGFEATVTSRKLETKVSPMRETRLGKLALGYMVARRVYHLVDIQELFEKNGYSPNSAGAVLTRLVEEGDLYRIDRGRYRLED